MNVTKRTQDVLMLVLGLSVGWLFFGCQERVPEPEPKPRPAATKKEDKPVPKELIKEDIKEGKGPAAENGDKLKVHYTGRLHKNNKKFDSSRDKGKPLPLTLGEGNVIKGWDQGLVGMKIGGKRKLTIPPDLAYGAKGQPPKIPPNAALVFDVELMEIEGKSADDDAEDGDAKKDDAKKDDAKKDDAKKDDAKKDDAKKDDAKKDDAKKDDAKKDDAKKDDAKKGDAKKGAKD